MRTEEGRLVLLFSGKKLLLLVFHEMECSVTSFFFFFSPWNLSSRYASSSNVFVFSSARNPYAPNTCLSEGAPTVSALA